MLQQMTELSLDTIQRQLKYLIAEGFVSAQKRRPQRTLGVVEL